VSTALYRRYRPDTFADVIGQEHVTEPLVRALDSGRINHAYLFSGPRGCGKTTSARILARCLNCERGPTGSPCGVCDSCVALARGGSGSIDVIEIDAASHGGVDDARELRERAAFAPAESRFKVYIIDEAHMVTTQGFNALLKIVEEPPEHVKFIFATTEPEKVIGTIRSRTHHYPFRLVPPARLHDYLEHLARAEGVSVEPGVLSFVVRAGGGSVRDSLSVLDQLIAGSDARGLTYDGAAALLGFTDGELLDATITAFGAGDAAEVFRRIDQVIETGLDPRRFVEDLLERFRDLIVLSALPDAGASVLRVLPADQIDRMRVQAAAFGAGALSRAADVVNAGLTEMTGATAPRLQLELIAARVLLPGAAGERGYAARLDRLERRLDVGGVPTGAVAGDTGQGRQQVSGRRSDVSAPLRDEPSDLPAGKSRSPMAAPAPTPPGGAASVPESGSAPASATPVANAAGSPVAPAPGSASGRAQGLATRPGPTERSTSPTAPDPTAAPRPHSGAGLTGAPGPKAAPSRRRRAPGSVPLRRRHPASRRQHAGTLAASGIARDRSSSRQQHPTRPTKCRRWRRRRAAGPPGSTSPRCAAPGPTCWPRYLRCAGPPGRSCPTTPKWSTTTAAASCSASRP
jgi:DNA polymerase-3 subunit gamma/tau